MSHIRTVSALLTFSGIAEGLLWPAAYHIYSLGKFHTSFSIQTNIDQSKMRTNISWMLESVSIPQDGQASVGSIGATDYDQSIDTSSSLDVRIHGTWYNLQRWKKAHPGGESWIDMYKNRDATEVMDSFHSEKARKMFSRLPKSHETMVDYLEKSVPKVSPIQKKFRAFRDELESKGWFQRDLVHETKLIGILTLLFICAVASAYTIPALSTALLSIAFTNSGWIGHDYIHGTDRFSERMRMFGALFAGLGCTWWSQKHNKHHAHTNQMGVDGDMGEGPLLYTYSPDPCNDSPLRKVQHLTFPFTFSLLFLLWRVRSIQMLIPALKEKRSRSKEELLSLTIHYLILFSVFPLKVWLPSILISGLLTAFIVTPTHQNDTFFIDDQEDWVTAQFRSTRNAKLTNPFSTWLWGGMQYQLEHHLFPTMPRSQYPKLKPLVQGFALENGLKYLESGEVEILKLNWELYRDVAKADPVLGAPKSTFSDNREKL